MSDMMKAVVVRVPGGPDALEHTELPVPRPGARQVLVKAHAIGAGGPDVLIRNGTYKWMPPLPAVPGNEMAGVVVAVGEGVADLAVGQRVLVSSRELPERGGCYAEYIAVPAGAPFVLPESISFDDAVSLGNFQLAQAMLQGCGGSTPAKSILVPGAAGGVATALVQIARHHGMQVIGTASTQHKRAYAMENGVSVLVDGQPAELPLQVMAQTGGRGVDLAFDHVGNELFMACIRSLAPFGTAVSYNIAGGPPAGDVFMALRALLSRSLAVRTFSIHTFDSDRAQRRGFMDSAIALMAAGHIRAPRTTVMPLGEVRRAHEILDAGTSLGKLVLRP
ncbi:NADPH2:quinone reductase [Variovorax sp. OK605]|uniref:zinc-dependent alcohol dehydrogenase family protein n=1 Tax=Variovorax sp. OK605 TaxID=1855317 RepID=UPI0008EE9709|nr:zinc-dependent alcohol dehydrogenase family protein [Variovorax sp. OK605]SFQ61859.1 NADPH2:quinone reductase [Variovorax sp. OK605]